MAAPNPKKSATTLHQEPLRWRLTSDPGSHGGFFSREAILLSVPPSSGVYGLFNADHQLFIGESDNIRNALLLHEYEAQCQLELIKPSGFTFALCSPEVREHMANDLIAKYQPVLQTGLAFTESRAQTGSTNSNERGNKEPTLDGDRQRPSGGEQVKHLKVRRLLPKKRKTALVSLVFAGVAILFYLGVPADDDFHMQAIGTESALALTNIRLEPHQATSIDAAGDRANENTEPTSAKPNFHSSTSTPNAPLPLEVKSTLAPDKVKLAEPGLNAQSTKSTNRGKSWSVQLSAAPTQAIADKMAQNLKAKGYKGYVVQAKVKERIYYRVRVGRFATREEADSVRQSLTRRDNYRDAYLTDDHDPMKNS